MHTDVQMHQWVDQVRKSKDETEHNETKLVTAQVQLKVKLAQAQSTGGHSTCTFLDVCDVHQHYHYYLDLSAWEAAVVAAVHHGVLDFPEVGMPLYDALYQRGRETGDCLCTACGGGRHRCIILSPCEIAVEASTAVEGTSPVVTTSTDVCSASTTGEVKAKKPTVVEELSSNSGKSVIG